MTADIIQVDYEELAIAAQRFQRQQVDIEALQQTVAGYLRALESGGWQGRGSKAFFVEMNETVLPGIGRLAESLTEASATIQKISDLFSAAEEEAAAQIDAGDGALLPPANGDSATGNNFDLPALFFQSNRLFLDVLLAMSENRSVTRELFKEFGRFLNELTGQRGHVGLMDDVYRTFFVKHIPFLDNLSFLDGFDKFLGSRWFEGGLVGVDATFGFFEDLQQGTYGNDYLKAGGVNTIDSLIQLAISKAHPYAMVALLVNSAVQVGGNMEVGIRRTLADLFAVDAEMGAMLRHDADQMDAALNKMDLGNITKEFSEVVYETGARRLGILSELSRVSGNGMLALAQDPSFHTLSRVGSSLAQAVDGHGADLFYMTNPMLAFLPSGSGNDWQNLFDVGKASANVLDGLADWGIASAASNAHMGVNSLAQWANSSPFVPDALKSAVTEGAKDMVRAQQKQADWLIGLIDF